MKTILKGFILFFLIAAGVFWGVLFFFLKSSPEKKPLLSTLNPSASVSAIVDQIPTPKARTNILLLGVDTLNKKKVARTDTIMLLSMDPESKSSFILSIPRDTLVKIKGSQDKVNAAHVYGGIPLAIETIQSIFHIPIHHYILVDYRALEKTVDDVGGVEMDVPMDMRYNDPKADPPLKINLKKGPQVLNGAKAMEFLRYRKGYEDQDIGRIKSQQYFMQKLTDKVLSPGSIPKIPNFIATFIDYVDTDLNKLELIALSKDFIEMGNSDIQKIIIPGAAKTINGLSYYVVDKKALNELERKLLNASSNSSTSDFTTIDSNIKLGSERILILNGNGKVGIANSASNLLKHHGATHITTGNANDYSFDKTYIYYKKSREQSEFISSVLKTGILMQGIPKDKDSDLDFVIILGKDYN